MWCWHCRRQLYPLHHNVSPIVNVLVRRPGSEYFCLSQLCGLCSSLTVLQPQDKSELDESGWIWVSYERVPLLNNIFFASGVTSIFSFFLPSCFPPSFPSLICETSLQALISISPLSGLWGTLGLKQTHVLLCTAVQADISYLCIDFQEEDHLICPWSYFQTEVKMCPLNGTQIFGLQV